MTAAQLIEKADDLAALGLYGDAWDVLESLLPADRMQPAVLSVQLKICQGLERWELGQDVARRIAAGDEPRHREAAGRFHLAHAIAQCAASDVLGARVAVWVMSLVWPEGREVALDSHDLAAIW